MSTAGVGRSSGIGADPKHVTDRPIHFVNQHEQKEKVQEGYDRHRRSIRCFERWYVFQQEIHEEREVGCSDWL